MFLLADPPLTHCIILSGQQRIRVGLCYPPATRGSKKMSSIVGFVDQPLWQHRRINGLLSGLRPAVARGGVGIHVAAHLCADQELGLRRFSVKTESTKSSKRKPSGRHITDILPIRYQMTFRLVFPDATFYRFSEKPLNGKGPPLRAARVDRQGDFRLSPEW